MQLLQLWIVLQGVATWAFNGEAKALRDVDVTWVYDWGVSPSSQVPPLPWPECTVMVFA